MASVVEVADRRRWPVVVVAGFALLSFLGSLAVGQLLFRRLSADNDEAVYVLEAKVLEAGHLTMSAPANEGPFRPWMSGRVSGDRLVLVEQPVLPALMAATDLVFGSFRVATALVAAAGVVAMFALARQLIRRDVAAVATAGCFALSPLVLVQSGLYVSYLLAVTLAAVTLTLLDRGLEHSNRWSVVGAGVAHGLLFFTRPLESLLLGIVIAVWLAARRFGAREMLTAAAAMAAGAAPMLLLCFAYNMATTGSPVRFPLWAIGGNDAFGFGDRTIAAGGRVIHVGPGEAFRALRLNLGELPHWLLGGLFALPVIGWGALQLWRTCRSALTLLVTIAVVYPVGYFFYYGNYLIISGRRFYGPHYYLGLLIPATMLLAVGSVDLARRRKTWAGAAAVILLAATVIEANDKIDRNLRVRDDADREAAAVDQAVRPPAIVIVPDSIDGPYVLHPRGAMGNPPDLRAAVLYAADLTGQNNDLFDRFPDRRIYRLQELDSVHGLHPDVTELHRRHGTRFRLVLSADIPDNAPARIAYVMAGNQSAWCPIAAGNDAITLSVTPTLLTMSGCVDGTRTEALAPGPATIVEGVAAGTRPLPLPYMTSTAVEAHYWIRDDGPTLDLIEPVDLWLRHDPQHQFRATDPTSIPWLHLDDTAT